MTKTFARALVCVAIYAPLASAQFRPPPASEAERLTFAADDTRAEAVKLFAAGNKTRAQEGHRRAIAQYEKALATDPNHVAAAAGLGASANAIGQQDKVVATLQPVVKAHPDADAVRYELGVAFFKLKRFPEAAENLEAVAPLNKPDQLLAHYYLGWYYLYAGRAEPAVTELRKYLALRPAAVAQNDGEIHQYLGRAFLLLRLPAEARASFQRAQAGRPEAIPVQMGLSAVLEMEGRKPEAISLLQGLASRHPQAPEPKERLGRLLLNGGDLARAETVALELLKLQASAGAHLLLGDVRLAQKQPKLAEADLRKAVALAPGQLSAQLSLGRALQQQGRNDEAIGLLEKAIAGGANTNDALAALGSIYRRAGRFQKAVEVHRRVVEANPTLALGHMLVAADHYATGQWDLAIDQYTEALKLEPNEPRARHFLALALSHRARTRTDAGRLDDAARDLRRAFDLDPAPQIARHLAAVLLTQENAEEARKVLAEAVKLPDASWKDHLLHGYAALSAGDPTSSVNAFEQAAKLTQSEPALADIYAGWALAKLEQGAFDVALAKLLEPGRTKTAQQVTQGNLPRALVRRALGYLKTGELPLAIRDVSQAEKLAVKDAEMKKLVAYARALVDLEEGKFDEATSGLRSSLNARWSNANARSLVEAYAEYRRGRMAAARRLLKAGERRQTPSQADFSKSLAMAVNRREGEQAYGQGDLALAQRALKAAFEAEPLNPYVINNQACVQYRRGQAGAAVAAWQEQEGALPEPSLNLAIDAHERLKNPTRAVEGYRRYLAANGAQSNQVREWKERLESLYGLGESAATVPVTSGERKTR